MSAAVMLTQEQVRHRVRIIVKADRDSAIGRGGYLVGDHFSPRMARLVHAVATATEELYPEALELHITEGWRPQRDPKKRDTHASLEAFDFTIVFPGGRRATFAQYRAIAERARSIVGDAEYDFLVHGEGTGVHIHAEFDPH